MALRLKGIAGSDAIAEMTGRETDEVEGVLQTMVEAGHAQETLGTTSASGRKRMGRFLAG